MRFVNRPSQMGSILFDMAREITKPKRSRAEKAKSRRRIKKLGKKLTEECIMY